MVMEAKKNGITNIVIPMDNIEEARLVKGVNIFAFNKLYEVTDFLIGVSLYEEIKPSKNKVISNQYIVDFEDVQG